MVNTPCVYMAWNEIMKTKQIKAFAIIIITIITATGFGMANAEETEYIYTKYPLERNGVALHLDCLQMPDNSPAGNTFWFMVPRILPTSLISVTRTTVSCGDLPGRVMQSGELI